MPKFRLTKENTGSGSGTIASTAVTTGSTSAVDSSSSQLESRGYWDSGNSKDTALEIIPDCQHGDSVVARINYSIKTTDDVLKELAKLMGENPDNFKGNVKALVPMVPSKVVEVMNDDTQKWVKAPFEYDPDEPPRIMEEFYDSDHEYKMVMAIMKDKYENPKLKKQRGQSMELLKRVKGQRDVKLAEVMKQELEGHHRLVEEIRKLKDDMEKSKALERKVWRKALKEVEAKATAAAAEAAEAKAETKKLSSDLEQEKLRAECAEEKLKAVDESQQAELEDHKHFIINGSRKDTMAYARILLRHVVSSVQVRFALLTGLSDPQFHVQTSRLHWQNKFGDYEDVIKKVAEAKKLLRLHVQRDQGLEKFLSTDSLHLIMNDQPLHLAANYDAHPGSVTTENAEKYREIAAAIHTLLPDSGIHERAPEYINACIDYLLTPPIPSNQST